MIANRLLNAITLLDLYQDMWVTTDISSIVKRPKIGHKKNTVKEYLGTWHSSNTSVDGYAELNLLTHITPHGA